MHRRTNDMQRIAKFEKVSFEQYKEGWLNCWDSESSDEEIRAAYDGIKLPRRATTGSAGYDFYTPVDFKLQAGRTILIPTGVRVRIDEGWVLSIYPRSGLGFKFRLQLDNTVGIIDSDYYNSANEGHIFIKITNDSKEEKKVSLLSGDAFAQGVFTQFGITVDDAADGVRDGGMGSTDAK